MKRVKLAIGVVAIGALSLAAAPATAIPAAVNVVALPNGTATGFAPTILAIVQGTPVDVVGADLQVHNLACAKRDRRRRPLCLSRVAALGESQPVKGIERLKPGNYSLLCTLHPQMKVELTVVGA